MSSAQRRPSSRGEHPRPAIHSGSDEPESWRGDAKISGRAVEITDPDAIAFAGSLDQAPPGDFELFRVDVTEVVVRLGDPADHLVIEAWHEGRGVTSVRR